MPEDIRQTIQDLFSSTDPADLLRGLALVEAAAPSAGPWERQTLCDMVVPLFYIDTLDHPEHMPVVEQAIAVIAGMGESAIPVLFENIEAGDVKADIAMAQALGLMGPSIIDPLIARYESGCGDPACRAFLLFALGKVKSPEIIKAAPLAIEAAASVELELRDTATRAIGKFAESIPAGALPTATRDAFVAQLQRRLADTSPGVRAKAVRSLGKLAKFGHLDGAQRAQLKVTLERILGHDDQFEWDRAYVVRKEAREALGYVA
jgi:HEAT repeat protein